MNDQITIDVLGIQDEESLHNLLFEAFKFPEYYGSNWDAFDECINDVPITGTITITNFTELELKVPRGAKLLKECLTYFAQETDNDIKIKFC